MDEGQLAQYMAVADLVLDEAVFQEQPKVQKFTYDGPAERYVHGLHTAYKNEAGEGSTVNDGEIRRHAEKFITHVNVPRASPNS